MSRKCSTRNNLYSSITPGVNRSAAPLLQLIFTVIFLAGIFYPAILVHADEIRPALLDIKQQNTGLFAVTWKVPTH